MLTLWLVSSSEYRLLTLVSIIFPQPLTLYVVKLFFMAAWSWERHRSSLFYFEAELLSKDIIPLIPAKRTIIKGARLGLFASFWLWADRHCCFAAAADLIYLAELLISWWFYRKGRSHISACQLTSSSAFVFSLVCLQILSNSTEKWRHYMIISSRI